MEVNNNSTAPPPPRIHNHTHNNSKLYQHYHNHNAILSSSSFLIIIASIISIAILLAIFLLIFMLHRLKAARNTAAASPAQSTTFIPHTVINFDFSPEVKGGGCLYGGNSGRVPQYRIRGVQVFTYKELELATDNFSEANVIGNGRFGFVYRGILADGAVVAIKMLLRDGKHRERAFRMEVNYLSFILLSLFLLTMAVLAFKLLKYETSFGVGLPIYITLRGFFLYGWPKFSWANMK